MLWHISKAISLVIHTRVNSFIAHKIIPYFHSNNIGVISRKYLNVSGVFSYETHIATKITGSEATRDIFIYPAAFALSRFCGKISIAVISEAGHGLLYR